jgi:Na+-transporting methylmalonyl-CoA/oxaloacetate decarboxylase gamma subunit
MSGLQEAFYIISIVYMGVMFVILIALLVAVIRIRNKVNRIHAQIEAKLDKVTNIAERSGEIAGLVTRKAKKAMRKVSK